VRVCACGCGESIEHLRPQAVYASDACRPRHWKERTGYEDRRARKADRNGKRKAPRRPSLRVSYLKAVEAIEPHVGSRERAEEILRPVLPPSARRRAA
jgi:hypothetical protein